MLIYSHPTAIISCSTCTFGIQRHDVRPPGWPFPASTDVFVLPSSSGRAALNNEERRAPYAELAGMLHSLPWLDKETIDRLEVEQSRIICAARSFAMTSNG